MSRTVMFMVSDIQENIENAKKYWENHNVTVHAFSSEQWRDGLNNVSFRQQLLVGVPALATGSNSVTTENKANVLQFPSPAVPVNFVSGVQKMEDIEANAIENAISQYKGNLTEAAKALGIGRATLYRKVKQYQIDPGAARKKKTGPVAA